MRYLSVCSGIEAASVAWEPLKWEAAGFAEIEPFPCAVLQHHYPKVKNFGDFTKIGKDDVGAIDLLVGGTPCQDFSLAGLRAGLAGDRGALTIEFLHLAERLRPRWLVWENVPGVLSADGGRAFGAFLGLLGKLGYGFAYRVFDAQYFGLAQRRRRVFVVGHFGDWRRAAAVLFESHSLSGSPAPRRKKRKGATLGIEIGSGGGCVTEVSPTLVTAFSCKDDGGDATNDISPTLRSMHHADGGQPNGGGQVAIASEASVRRLLPVECEKLQGFPPGYTLVPYRGKPASDSSRYRSLGNSMAVPVMNWIGRRIDLVNKHAANR